MIAMLSGQTAEKRGEMAVIDVHGVGYGVFVTAEDFGALTVGGAVKLYIYEHIRENSHDLFGFAALNTKALFEQLLSVNGVGPKMALNVLSIGRSDEVRQAIAGGDVKYIQQASGVGKRVAERIVVDLKDKVGLVGVDIAATGLLQSGQSSSKDDAAEALMALGYSAQDAAHALSGVDGSLPTEDRVRLALKGGK